MALNLKKRYTFTNEPIRIPIDDDSGVYVLLRREDFQDENGKQPFKMEEQAWYKKKQLKLGAHGSPAIEEVRKLYCELIPKHLFGGGGGLVDEDEGGVKRPVEFTREIFTAELKRSPEFLDDVLSAVRRRALYEVEVSAGSDLHAGPNSSTGSLET